MQSQNNDNDPRAMWLLRAVEDTVRRMGGRQFLTAEEYLEIVNYHYRQIYKAEPPADIASTT